MPLHSRLNAPGTLKTDGNGWDAAATAFRESAFSRWPALLDSSHPLRNLVGLEPLIGFGEPETPLVVGHSELWRQFESR
jgi:hypothetical protein